MLITIFHSCSLVFNCIAAVQSLCSFCGHPSSLVFSGIPFVFTRVPFVFTRVPFVFTRVPFVFTRVHLCSLVFTRVHQCSLVFWLVWSFRSDPPSLLQILITTCTNIFDESLVTLPCNLVPGQNLGNVYICGSPFVRAEPLRKTDFTSTPYFWLHRLVLVKFSLKFIDLYPIGHATVTVIICWKRMK